MKDMEKKIVYELEAYTIDLAKIDEGESIVFNFMLDDTFFSALEQTEIESGSVKAQLNVSKKSSTYEFVFDFNGFVQVPCDRCLAEVKYPVEAYNELFVKLGEKTEEVDDDLIFVSGEERKLNVAWLMYEYISLSLPIMRSHEEGECDEQMLILLDQHNAENVADDDEQQLDPRWNELRKILDNN